MKTMYQHSDKNPFFSIFIPAKGRPGYLVDAIESVLLQEFEDMEIVISNNGADIALKEVVMRYSEDPRINYVEQPETLAMPMHWEKVTKDLAGDYLLVLTDRSVMKVGTLRFLHEQIMQTEKWPDVISWSWDLYYDHLKILLRHPNNNLRFKTLNSDSQLKSFAQGVINFPYSLPRGLNSCVRNEFIASIRAKHGLAFRTLNPDFTFAYLCLLNTEQYVYIDSPLFISQGLNVSIGGNAYKGDASEYFNSLKLEDPFKHVPVKLPIDKSGIHEDFLSMASLCGRSDLLKLWNKSNYYLECFAEVEAKREAGILQDSLVDMMERDLVNTLKSEPMEIRESVNKVRTPTKKFRSRIRGVIKRLLGSKLESIRRYILLYIKGGLVFSTALESAGFETTVGSKPKGT